MRDSFNQEIKEFIFDGNLPLHNNRAFFIHHLAPYVFFADLCKNKDVLEIGIGEGFGCYYLSKRSNQITTLDFDFSVWPQIERYNKRFNMRNINFVMGNGCKMPFKDGSFDRIISCQVIEHIPEELLEEFLKEINRCLKKEGRALISTLNVEHNIKNPKKYEKFPQHHKEFNKKDLSALCNNIFSRVSMFGLNLSLKHNFFLRLKRWGFMYHDFFNNMAPDDFVVSKNITKASKDLFALCYKG